MDNLWFYEILEKLKRHIFELVDVYVVALEALRIRLPTKHKHPGIVVSTNPFARIFLRRQHSVYYMRLLFFSHCVISLPKYFITTNKRNQHFRRYSLLLCLSRGQSKSQLLTALTWHKCDVRWTANNCPFAKQASALSSLTSTDERSWECTYQATSTRITIK